MTEIGTRFGKYVIESKIGVGGMADVYLARDTDLDRVVALKLLPPEFARDDERVVRFQKEVRAAARLSHPHIVTLYDVAQVDGTHFYTMEYITGGDLKEKIQAGLRSEECIEIIKQVASALAHAHDQGFVHRDLKPENILFREDGTAVLTDFGIAKVVGSGTRMTKTGMSIGTPHYMSPEQARGLELDRRSDLYSMGILLYEMLTGAVPYDAPETFAVGLKHINDPLPNLPREQKKYQPLIDHLLCKDPQDRYADAATLIRAVDSLENGQRPSRPVHATRVMKTVPQSTVSAGMKWGVGGGAVALILGLIAYLYFLQGPLFQLPSKTHTIAAGGGGVASSNTATMAEQRSPVEQQPAGAQTVIPKSREIATLAVQSEPTGAEVYLDERFVGNTPLTLPDLKPDNYSLQLKKGRYVSEVEHVELKPSQVLNKNITLVVGKGSLAIVSEPAGSTVWLDGRKLDGVTPLTVHEIEAGEYAVRVEKDRYYGQKEKVAIEAGKTSSIDLKLEGGDLVSFKGEWVTKEEAEEKEVQQLTHQAEEYVKTGKLSLALDMYNSAHKLQPDNDDLKKKAGAVQTKLLAVEKRSYFQKMRKHLDDKNTEEIEKVVATIESLKAPLTESEKGELRQAAEFIRESRRTESVAALERQRREIDLYLARLKKYREAGDVSGIKEVLKAIDTSGVVLNENDKKEINSAELVVLGSKGYNGQYTEQNTISSSDRQTVLDKTVSEKNESVVKIQKLRKSGDIKGLESHKKGLNSSKTIVSDQEKTAIKSAELFISGNQGYEGQYISDNKVNSVAIFPFRFLEDAGYMKGFVVDRITKELHDQQYFEIIESFYGLDEGYLPSEKQHQSAKNHENFVKVLRDRRKDIWDGYTPRTEKVCEIGKQFGVDTVFLSTINIRNQTSDNYTINFMEIFAVDVETGGVIVAKNTTRLSDAKDVFGDIVEDAITNYIEKFIPD